MEVINKNEVKVVIAKDESEVREILNEKNSSIENLSLAEATIKPGCSTVGHYHRNSEEIYYILSGCGSIIIDNESRKLVPNDAVVIPPKARHKIENIGEDDLIILCCCSPPYEEDDTVLEK